MRIEQNHAVGDVREHALRDRALLLGDACPRERWGQGVSHEHHDPQDDDADQHDPATDRRRRVVHGVVGRENADSRLGREPSRHSAEGAAADHDRSRLEPAKRQDSGEGSRCGDHPAASLGDGDLLLVHESRLLRDPQEGSAVKRNPGDDRADNAVAGDDVDRALHDARRRRAGAPAGEEQQVGVRLAQAL